MMRGIVPLNERGQERHARPLVVGCSTETGSDAGKVFLRASSSASSWRLRLSLRHRLMRFAFRIGNHFGFSDGADEDLQGYDANFGALLDELYPFRVIRLPYNILVANTSIGSFPITRQGWKLMRRQSAGASITATPFFTDFCTFSKARTSIWRTRSRDTPNSAAKSSSVIASSAS